MSVLVCNLPYFPVEPMLKFGPSCGRCGYRFTVGDEYAHVAMPDRGDGVTRSEAVCVLCAEAAT